GKGIMILEIQQSSDITYRVYDYDRTGSKGNKRELHLDRAKQVTSVPHELKQCERPVKKENGLHIEKLIEAQYLSVYNLYLDVEVSCELTVDLLIVLVTK